MWPICAYIYSSNKQQSFDLLTHLRSRVVFWHQRPANSSPHSFILAQTTGEGHHKGGLANRQRLARHARASTGKLNAAQRTRPAQHAFLVAAKEKILRRYYDKHHVRTKCQKGRNGNHEVSNSEWTHFGNTAEIV